VAEEENIVEQNSVESPLRRISRLTAPRRDAFGPSNAEIGALALLNQQGAPQVLGFLGGLNADRLRAQDAYEQNLDAVNTQQSALARMADATARRGQDVNLARTYMQTPDAGSTLQMLQPLLTPQGVQDARAFTTTRLGLRNSEIALNNARTVDALRGPSGGGRANGGSNELTPPQLIAVRDRVERAGDNAMREVLTRSRAPNSFNISNGQVIPLPGTAPLTPAQIAEAQAAREAARQRARTELSALDPRFGRAMESMFGASAPAAPAAPAQATPTPAQAEAAPAQSPHAARVANARRLGWNDRQLREQLAREGVPPEEINAALAR
jgi:hypothetical protein